MGPASLAHVPSNAGYPRFCETGTSVLQLDAFSGYHLGMARKIVHQLVDDLDGTVLEPGEGETVLFSLDGKSYEIDLTAENAQALRDSFTKYIDAARRMTSGASSSASSSARGRRRTGQTDYGPVREWAKQNGYTVSARGRVPATVIEAYEAAH